LNRGLALAWLAEIILISVRDYRNSSRLPWPSELLATFIFFGALSVLPDGPGPAAVGWGFVAATYLGIYDPSKQRQATPQQVTVGGRG
jgi:hypothetical protein